MRMLMLALVFLASLLLGCSSTLTPAERVKLGVETLEQACGFYLTSTGAHEPKLDDFCKAIVVPPTAAPSALPPVAAATGDGGRAVVLDGG